MAGSLTTHVLDTARGCPAAHVKLSVWHLGKEERERRFLKEVLTNQQGRTDTPLLLGEELQIGYYELLFSVGEYFARQELTLTDPPFLNTVSVRFGVADSQAHYHVPLLVSPWAYSMYRGS